VFEGRKERVRAREYSGIKRRCRRIVCKEREEKDKGGEEVLYQKRERSLLASSSWRKRTEGSEERLRPSKKVKKGKGKKKKKKGDHANNFIKKKRLEFDQLSKKLLKPSKLI